MLWQTRCAVHVPDGMGAVTIVRMRAAVRPGICMWYCSAQICMAIPYSHVMIVRAKNLLEKVDCTGRKNIFKQIEQTGKIRKSRLNREKLEEEWNWTILATTGRTTSMQGLVAGFDSRRAPYNEFKLTLAPSNPSTASPSTHSAHG